MWPTVFEKESTYRWHGAWCLLIKDRGPLVTDYKKFPEESHVSFQDVCKMQAELRKETKKDRYGMYS